MKRRDREEIRNMMTRYFYFIANAHEGCGHRHRKKRAAERCRRLLNRRGFKGRLYMKVPGVARAYTSDPRSTFQSDRTWQRKPKPYRETEREIAQRLAIHRRING